MEDVSVYMLILGVAMLFIGGMFAMSLNASKSGIAWICIAAAGGALAIIAIATDPSNQNPPVAQPIAGVVKINHKATPAEVVIDHIHYICVDGPELPCASLNDGDIVLGHSESRGLQRLLTLERLLH